MPLDNEQWSALARELRRAAARAAPGWTDSGSHDPGVTVLELLAFALADLRYRTSARSPHMRGLAQEVARHAAALATTTAAHADDEGGAGLRRVSYFAGQLLGVDDFQAEQDYLLDRLSRRNRLLHGAGIVDGLAVTVDPGAGAPAVVIAPGLAFDPRGREIYVDAPCRLALPASIAALLVQLTYREQPCANVALVDAPPDATAGDAATRPSRIVEIFAATLAAAPAADAVMIARLHRVRGRWRIDAKLEPLRARR